MEHRSVVELLHFAIANSGKDVNATWLFEEVCLYHQAVRCDMVITVFLAQRQKHA